MHTSPYITWNITEIIYLIASYCMFLDWCMGNVCYSDASNAHFSLPPFKHLLHTDNGQILLLISNFHIHWEHVCNYFTKDRCTTESVKLLPCLNIDKCCCFYANQVLDTCVPKSSQRGPQENYFWRLANEINTPILSALNGFCSGVDCFCRLWPLPLQIILCHVSVFFHQ